MRQYLKNRLRSVEARGAAAGCVVRGGGMNNQGVRIKVLCEQPKGNGGAIRGAFVLLDAGDNRHAGALRPLVGLETNAEEVLRVTRRDVPSCLSVANANILVPEERPRKEGAQEVQKPSGTDQGEIRGRW